MQKDPTQPYALGVLEQELRLREAKKIAKAVAPFLNNDGSPYDLGNVARVTRAIIRQREIIRRLVSRW